MKTLAYSAHATMPPKRRTPKGFTLIELTSSLAVFALVTVGVGGTLISSYETWRRQRAVMDTVGNTRWAMERISQETQEADQLQTQAGGTRVRLGNGPSAIWYWQGNGGAFGSNSILYRGVGSNIAQANNVRQELTEDIINNPSGASIFSDNGMLLTIELTAQNGKQIYTLQSQVRARN